MGGRVVDKKVSAYAKVKNKMFKLDKNLWPLIEIIIIHLTEPVRWWANVPQDVFHVSQCDMCTLRSSWAVGLSLSSGDMKPVPLAQRFKYGELWISCFCFIELNNNEYMNQFVCTIFSYICQVKLDITYMWLHCNSQCQAGVKSMRKIYIKLMQLWPPEVVSMEGESSQRQLYKTCVIGSLSQMHVV